MKSQTLLLVAPLILLFATHVGADFLVSNMNQQTDPGLAVELPDRGMTNVAGKRIAANFRTGSQPFALESINALLRYENSNPFDLHIGVWSDSNGLPGAEILRITESQAFWGPNVLCNVSTIPPAAVILQPDTDYWLTIGNDSTADNRLLWEATGSTNTFGEGSLSSAVALSSDSGYTWGFSNCCLNSRVSIQLQGTALPEPATCLAVVAGIAGLVFVRRGVSTDESNS